MCDEWMRPLELTISFDEFLRLPRNNGESPRYEPRARFQSERFCKG